MILVVLCSLWVLASAVVAMLPMKRQYLPGVILLLAAPVLILLLGLRFGWVVALLAALAFVSMYRNPLRFLWARLCGKTPEVPR